MAKGNINEALRMVIIGLLLGAILSPFYITVMLGSEISVPIMQIIFQIIIVVFVPLALAYLTQKLIVKKYGKMKFNKDIKQKFPLFSTLGITMMIFVAIALKAPILVNNPKILLDILLPLIIMFALFLLVPVVTARMFFNRKDGVALVNGTLIRNLALALAITLSVFPNAGLTALLIAIAYVLQVQIAAWNSKLSQFIFKSE